MKIILILLSIATSISAIGCNNESNIDEHTDSVANTIGPGNSPVRPNSNSEVVPTGQEGSSGGLDTANIDSLTPPDTVTKK